MDLDDKVSFFSGSSFTLIMTAPLYELWMALALGIIGGFGGVIGKYLFYFIKDKWLK